MADSDGHLSRSENPGHTFNREDLEIGTSGDIVTGSLSNKQTEIVMKDVLNALTELKERKAKDPTDTQFTCQLDTVQKYLEQIDQKSISPLNVAQSEDVHQSISTIVTNRKNEEKLNVVIAEYEKAISQLVRNNAVVVKERDTVQKHLANAEAAFSDVHQKYERCKDIIEGFKNNETILKESIRKNEEEILRLNSKYEALKTHAMGQLEKANNELSEYRRDYSDEIIRLKATIQKLELQNSSLKQSVEQRTKECEELTRICDDLITKVGR